MFTDDMLLAARRDGLDKNFVYALAGCSGDSECGKCYQVQPLDAEKTWRPDFPQLVVQCVNSGFDVLDQQLDLYVGAGGFGYFTALNSDCRQNHCEGGGCSQGMYDGDFAAWTDAEFPDRNKCYSGGVKYFDYDTEATIWEKCRRLSGSSNELKDRILWDSCGRSNLASLHQNFYAMNVLRVACPESLYRLSGMQRSDDAGLPQVNIGNQLPTRRGGNRDQGQPVITTMHDGCVPSCSWPGKVNTNPGYTRVDRCGRDGRILNN
jgi:hypothetical protein